MTPPPTRVYAALPIVDAPEPILDLFARWCAEGLPWQIERELAGAMQPHRGVRLLTPLYVIWLTKASDRNDDEVCIAPRSWPLRTKVPGKEYDRQAPRDR